MTQLEIVKSFARLQCTACGAEATASCNCGKPYVPAAIRVAEYDKVNPGKSTRAAAADLGISKSAVNKARDQVSTGGHVVGIDGKTYQAKGKTRPDFEALQARAERLGWHLDRREKGKFALWHDIDDPNLCGCHVYEIPIALRDVAETLDDIEHRPEEYLRLTGPQPPKASAAPPKPIAAPPPTTESDDEHPAKRASRESAEMPDFADLCVFKVTNAIDIAVSMLGEHGASKAEFDHLFAALKDLVAGFERKAQARFADGDAS